MAREAGPCASLAGTRGRSTYTRIDRDVENRPRFRSHGFRLTKTRYFYPASTVKLPVAALALEKLNDLARPGLDCHTPFLVEGSGGEDYDLLHRAMSMLPRESP